MITAQHGRPLTVFGDGKPVRNVPFIDDVVDVFDLAARSIDRSAGCDDDVGGGPTKVISLLDLLGYLERRLGHTIQYHLADRCPSHRLVFVDDIRRAALDLDWAPKIRWERDLDLLNDWVGANKELFE
jgi:CDP-paratose 2-epimerase